MRNEIRRKLGTQRASATSRVPSGVLWPNGEFGLGFVDELAEIDPSREWAWCGEDNGPSGPVDDAETLPPLILSDVRNSHRRGLGGITTYGRRMVRSGAYLVEELLGTIDCAFWTFTVPTLGKDARVNLASNWGKAVNRLVQWMSRKLIEAGRAPAIVGVTEIQSGRLKKYTQGYLHLHILCPLHSNGGGRFAIDVPDAREFWREEIMRRSGAQDIPEPRIEAAMVRKSAEAYLGKYMSKGAGEDLDGFIDDLGVESVPGQWWFMSSLLRKAVMKRTSRGRNTGVVLDRFIQESFESGDLSDFEFIRHVDLVCDSGFITAGWYGKLRKDAAERLRDFFAILPSESC